MLGHLRPKLIVAVACCSIVALTACGSGDSASTGTSSATSSSSKEKRIAFFTDGLDNPYLTTAVDAAKQAAADGGAELDVISANWDANAQIGQVQDALASGKYDALVVESVDGVTLCKSVTRAAEDLVVSVFNTPICGRYKELYTPGTVGYFGRDEYVAGQLLGTQAAKALGGKGTLGYISGHENVGRVQMANKGIKDALAKYPDVKLVAQIDGQEDPAKGLAATQDILQSNPDVDGLLYYVDHMAIPSIKWMQQNNKLGDRKIVTLGGTTQGFDLIKQGIITASIMSLPREEAAYAVTAAINTLDGKPIEIPGWDPDRKVWDALNYPKVPSVITKQNVDSVEPEWHV